MSFLNIFNLCRRPRGRPSAGSDEDHPQRNRNRMDSQYDFELKELSHETEPFLPQASEKMDSENLKSMNENVRNCIIEANVDEDADFDENVTASVVNDILNQMIY